MTAIAKGSFAGLLAGNLLGLFLNLVESVTGLKVYILLLNVDYIPFLKDIKVSEIIEFLLHLIVSMVLGVLLHIYLIKKDFPIKQKVRFVVKVSLLIGLFLYPTTMLSDRTPEISSAYSFLFWMVGHGLYGVALGKLLIYGKRVRGVRFKRALIVIIVVLLIYGINRWDDYREKNLAEILDAN